MGHTNSPLRACACQRQFISHGYRHAECKNTSLMSPVALQKLCVSVKMTHVTSLRCLGFRLETKFTSKLKDFAVAVFRDTSNGAMKRLPSVQCEYGPWSLNPNDFSDLLTFLST